MGKRIFPVEVIEFSAENHFVKHHSASKMIYLAMVLMFAVFLLSLPFIKVDITTQSRGVIRTPNENTVLQSSVYGEILRVNLTENQSVKQGDTLLWFRTDKIDEELAALQKRWADNVLNMQDIGRLMGGKTPLGYKYASELRELQTKINELNTQMQFAEKESVRTALLYKKNVISEADYLQDKNRYEMAVKQLEFTTNEYRNRWQTENKRLELENIDLVSRRTQLQKEKRNYSVLASADGSIVQTTGLQPGNFVVPGQKLGNLSQDKQLIAECYVKPSDIGFLQLNQSAELQLDAYNYREWGVVPAHIIEISNDALTVGNKEPFFRVRCKLHVNSLALKNGFRGKVKKGMSFTSQFYLTRRSLAQLIFDKVDNWMNPGVVHSGQ